ncbi:monoacylglycerol lipase abhd6-A-like isoform X2 [Ptychodera flava]|uniref:monoacylglycerol lipase abhd6-A-like isoform X2 n=1 Tax=Ptychodera flava TaxID=63121 RepID=UPI00396A8CAF
MSPVPARPPCPRTRSAVDVVCEVKYNGVCSHSNCWRSLGSPWINSHCKCNPVYLQTSHFVQFLYQALPTDVHVIILDMPGHGKTSRDMKADYTFVGQAKNIHHFVQAYGLDKSPFHILGISMGGGVAGVYAALYPQDLVKVSLFCPAAILSPTVSKYGQEMVKDETVPLPVTAQEIKNTQPYIVYNGREMPNWVYRIIAELRRPHNEFYRHVLQEMNKEDSKTALQARLCDIKTPTQVVWGEFDWLLDISSLDIIKEKLKSLDRIDVLDRCGHSIAMERPYKSAKVIMEFVNS